MDRFICVRVVQGYGMDLTLFQYDFWSTWSAFLMNGDRTIYARFTAGRLHDLERLKKTLQATLEAHAAYPKNKEGFAGKKGLALPWTRPEKLPVNRGRNLRRVRGRGSCIHCHHILEGLRKSYRTTRMPMPARIAAEFPTTGRIGISMDTRSTSTISQVLKGTVAQQAGLQVGDRVEQAGGQIILSIADFEWALYAAPDEGAIDLVLHRGETKLNLSVPLRKGWRTAD